LSSWHGTSSGWEVRRQLPYMKGSCKYTEQEIVNR